jgi:hypothetical protein
MVLQDSILLAQMLLGHLMGMELSQKLGDKHSLLSAKHRPSQHKMGKSLGQMGIAGQSLGEALQVLS